MRQAYIGTSGWNYRTWKDSFYIGIPQKQWLGFYAERFDAVEVNATFYRLQTKATFASWRAQVPAHFRFAIKGNRYLTHNKKLLDPESSIRLDRQRATGLGDKLAAVLWQMPHTLRKDIDRLRAFAKALGRWPEARHALEFRHASWFDDEVAECLHSHRLATCLSDAADWPMWDALTTDMAYVRLHGHTRTYASAYATVSLKEWASRVGRWRTEGRDVHVYFDNDAEGAAPCDALRLIGFVREDR